MSEPLISIVLPTYNGSRYIRRSIESCLNQIYRNLELIIVNDCSTDETPEIIQQYAAKDSRVYIINNEVNKKLPSSLNIGFTSARGKYFTWTSDDNYYADNAMQTLVNVLERDRSTDIVYADYYEIDEDGKISSIKNLGDINESVVLWKGCGACFLYKREVHERNKGYNTATLLIEDYDFFLRAFFHSKFHYLKTPDLYYYRLHESSLTGTLATAVHDIQKIVVEKHIPQLIKHLSEKDLGLLYRKYAIYYAVYKNNAKKVNYYLRKLYSVSKSQTFVTVLFVVFKKTITGITVSFSAIWSLIKLIVKSPKRSD